MCWLIEGNQSRWTYPSGATGGIDALEAMESRLTGFNDERVVRALGRTSKKRFVAGSDRVRSDLDRVEPSS